jgi:hypothetical protein
MIRFKIDINPRGSYEPFTLFWRKPTFFGGSWVKIDDFKTHEDARSHYHKIKDLPEYLP